jgi:predicted ATPase/DNA-binding SARP family transcriptional activator
MIEPWRIEMLGWLRAVQGEQVVSRFRTRKTGALLAYLAFHLQRSHTREALIELLWPESAPELGRNSLSKALTSLRHQLEPPSVPAGAVIMANRDHVQLNPAAVIPDVAAFETALRNAARTRSSTERVQWLTEAVELYRGELLPGQFDDWILQERQRLSEAFSEALDQLVCALQESGAPHAALQWARRAVAADPLREEAHHHLIRLLLAADQPDAALRQYQELQRLLAEIGAAPDPEIQALVQKIQPRGRTTRAPSRFQQADGRPCRGLLSGPAAPRPTEAGTAPAESAMADFGPADRDFIPGDPRGAHLPLQFTRFFGRDAELAQLQARLQAEDTRLVTLTGPGGSGKTRLAIRTAQQLPAQFTGGVWFVPLVDVADHHMIVDKARDALHLPRSPGVEPLEQVVAFLSRQPCLLLLDNFEHLVEAGASLVQTLLERVPTLTCLVTSRQCLDLAAEREFPVAPLPTPPPVPPLEGEGGLSVPEQLLTYPSVQLFVDRAQAVRPDFQVTEANAAALAALCTRLEGLPLALALAASRARMLTVAQMLERMEHRFELLVSRKRAVDARHQSLRATLDWSCQLLAPELQQFFARLSIFRGGWTFEAAEAVCEEPKALEYLEHLQECSLVQAQEQGTAMRYRLLETLREYGREQLAPEALAVLERRHAAFFLRLAEAAEPELFAAAQKGWLDQLEREHDNLRAALAWSREKGGVETALRLLASLGTFWEVRGDAAEAREQLISLLARPEAAGPTPLRAKALHCAGLLAYFLGDFVGACSSQEESLGIYQGLGDGRGTSLTLLDLGFALTGQGGERAARLLFEEGLARCRELGEWWGVAHALYGLGQVNFWQSDYAAARERYEESLSYLEQLGDQRHLSSVLSGLGGLAWCQEDLEAARSLCQQSLAIRRALGDPGGVAASLSHLGQIALLQGDLQAALSYYEESLVLRRQLANKTSLARALCDLALVERMLVRGEAARRHSEESLALGRAVGDRPTIARSLTTLGVVALRRGEHELAEALHQESMETWPEADRRYGRAWSLVHLAEVALAREDLETAQLLAQESLEIMQEAGPAQDVAYVRDHLGQVAHARGDREVAHSHYAGSLSIGRRLRHPVVIARSLQNLGALAIAEGDQETARLLYVESLALQREIGDPSGLAACLEGLARLATAQD